MTNTDELELLSIARNVATEAGALAADMRSSGVSVHATKSNQLDIVTQADMAVEALIRQRLATARPEDGFLGEESERVEGTSGTTWIVDPIDGTVNYLYGSPYYAVSIAATVRNDDGTFTSIASCVYAPVLSACYTAALGQPARLNDTPMRINEMVPLDKALVSTGIPYDLDKRGQVIETITALIPRVRDLRLVGAASLEICGVAEGRTDAHYQRGLPVWDYAAATLIASQAGAEIRGANGAPPSSNELLLIARPELANELEPLLG